MTMETKRSSDRGSKHQQKMFISAPKTDFADFWRETEEFIKKHPEILEAIEEDQKEVGRRKKELRIKDKQYQRKKNQQIDGVQLPEGEGNKEDLRLEGGRPRMSPWLVFMFLATRGYKGGVSTREFQDFVRDSMTIHAALGRRGERMPGRTTISENLNAVSNRTRMRILEAQIDEIIEEGLDDFEKMTIDSTAVSSASEWPTDALLIKKLIERVWEQGSSLEERFGLEDFDRHWMETWIKKMTQCVLAINTAGDGRTRKKEYRRLFEFAESALNHLREQRKEFERSVTPGSFKPSRRETLEEVRDRIRGDLKKARKKVENARRRVLEGESVESKKKC